MRKGVTVGFEVTAADAYRIAGTMAEAGEWFTGEQTRIGDRLGDFHGLTGSGQTDEVVMFAVIRVLRRAAGMGYVLDGVARNLRATGLNYEETDEHSRSLFSRARQGDR
jgi:hypothetical protein